MTRAPFDLDAAMAEGSDEGRPPFEFAFGGESFSLPLDPDLRAIALLDNEDFYNGLRLLLGAEQWDRLLALDAVFGAEAFKALILAWQSYVTGGAEGGSSASTGS